MHALSWFWQLTLRGVEIGEVPDELPYEEPFLPQLVERLEVLRQTRRLVLLGPHVLWHLQTMYKMYNYVFNRDVKKEEKL